MAPKLVLFISLIFITNVSSVASFGFSFISEFLFVLVFLLQQEGATLLHYAVFAASSQMIKILLLYNVDINLQDNVRLLI